MQKVTALHRVQQAGFWCAGCLPSCGPEPVWPEPAAGEHNSIASLRHTHWPSCAVAGSGSKAARRQLVEVVGRSAGWSSCCQAISCLLQAGLPAAAAITWAAAVFRQSAPPTAASQVRGMLQLPVAIQQHRRVPCCCLQWLAQQRPAARCSSLPPTCAK